MPETDRAPLSHKVAVIVLACFMLLFFKYRPYEHSGFIPQSTVDNLFALYFFISNQTLGMVHESGHGVCYLLGCPLFISTLNGTVFQLLFPLLAGYYYKRRGQRLGWLIGLFFLGFSLHYTAWYMSTAHVRSIVPASEAFLGVEGLHDFNYIFSQLHLLQYNRGIARVTQLGATLIMLYATLRMLLHAFWPAPQPRRAVPQRARRMPGNGVSDSEETETP